MSKRDYMKALLVAIVGLVFMAVILGAIISAPEAAKPTPNPTPAQFIDHNAPAPTLHIVYVNETPTPTTNP